MISELQKRRVAFSKRYPTLFKKAEELATRTGSDVSVRVRSPTGRTFYCSYQTGKLIASNIDPRTGKVNSSTGLGPKEWEEGLVKQEFDAYMAKEDLQSVIANYEARLAYARERLGNWENNPSVKAGDSGVKVDRETEEMADEGIGSILKSSGHVDSKSFWTSLLKRTAGSPSDPRSSGLDDGEFNPDPFLNLSEKSIGDGDRPENSAFGGGYNPDDFAGLGDLDIPLDIGYF